MEFKKYNIYFLFFLLAVVTGLALLVFKPFLMAVLIAVILAVTLQKPYNFFLKITGKRKNLSALATSLFGVLVFVAIIVFIVGLVANEVTNLYQASISGQDYGNKINLFLQKMQSAKPFDSLGLENVFSPENVTKAASQVGQWALFIIQGVYQGTVHFIFLAFVIFFTLYYLLMEGKKVMKRVMYLSPLKNKHEKTLIKKFVSISRATIKGTLIVGSVQGLLGGVLFAVVGIPSAGVWGIVMAALSLIPMIGSSIVWFPAGVILLLSGNIWQGITVLVIGLGLISIIDNFLRPKLVGKDTQMHPLVVFFSTLGGISLFGIVGFIIGPIIAALFLSLWDIYAVEFKQQLDEYDSKDPVE
jgi:predicted PurR-regulated permease PerM